MVSATSGELLNSWKEIAKYFNCGIRTVQRWEAHFGLPVRRLGPKRRSGVMAMRSEIDGWLKSRALPHRVAVPAARPLVADEGSIRFIRTEIESGFTFASLAMTAQRHETQKIDRNLRNALKAYSTAVKFRHRYFLEVAVATDLDAGLAQLAHVLHAGGRLQVDRVAVNFPLGVDANS